MKERTILLADADPSFPAELVKAMNRPRWTFLLAGGFAEAQSLLGRHRVDAAIIDAGLPGGSSAELLQGVRTHCPAAIRLSLSGRYDHKAALNLMEYAHHNIWKPCTAEVVSQTLVRALALQDALQHDRLKLLIAQMDSLPSLPRLYLDFLDEVRKTNPSSARLSDIISRDISLCSRMLQLVNSAFFGLPHKIDNPEEALLYLGLENVKALVLSIQVFSLYEKIKLNGFSLESLWTHSWETGRLARQIATFEKRPVDEIETAFTAGLLHDVGQLVLASGVPRTWQKIVDTAQIEGLTLWQAEEQILGTTHAEVGAALLATWGLSDALVEAVAFHHHPEHSGASQFSALTAVYAANLLAENTHPKGPAVPAQPAYLNALRLTDHLGEWRERFLETAA